MCTGPYTAVREVTQTVVGEQWKSTDLKATSVASYLVGRALIVRQYLRPSYPARPVYHLAARIGLAFLNSADVSKSKLPPLARIGHHYNVETAEILGCRVRDIAFWQPFQEI